MKLETPKTITIVKTFSDELYEFFNTYHDKFIGNIEILYDDIDGVNAINIYISSLQKHTDLCDFLDHIEGCDINDNTLDRIDEELIDDFLTLVNQCIAENANFLRLESTI